MYEHYAENNSVEDCIDILNRRIHSLEKVYGNNYWKVCLYKALSVDKKTFQDFLSCPFNNQNP